MAQVVPQVEQTSPLTDRDRLEIRLPEGELHTAGIEQAEFGRGVGVIGGDDEVEMSRHGLSVRRTLWSGAGLQSTTMSWQAASDSV